MKLVKRLWEKVKEERFTNALIKKRRDAVLEEMRRKQAKND